jgi:simple sugar transport system ATP-binding protein
MKDIEKHFGPVIALNGVSFDVRPGECHCLLGDNGAGKSTFIKTMSGVHKPTRGRDPVRRQADALRQPARCHGGWHRHGLPGPRHDPADERDRNFWMGQRTGARSFGPLKLIDFRLRQRVTMQEMRKMGINLRSPDQAVGTLSGGERQTVAIARAVYFGAKVLILDEPTSALGVRQTANVLATIDKVRKNGIGVVFITHNVRHALAVGDRFTVLNRGKTLGTRSGARSRPRSCRT